MAKMIKKYLSKKNTINTMPASGELYAKTFNEAEIHKRALSDPDAQPLTEKQLRKFKRVNAFIKKK